MSDQNESGIAARNNGVRAVAEGGRAMSEVQSRILLAKKFPRDHEQAVKKILMDCKRPGLASEAVYEYPRGNEKVIGPSIRLAEAIAREWGNLDYGILEIDREAGVSTMCAYCWDLETNTRASTEFKVAHVRDTRSGRTDLKDERDIYEAVANAGARRLRAVILKQIPGDVVEQAVAECNMTMRAQIGDIVQETKDAVEAFADLGITRRQIEKRLRHNIEAVSAAELLDFRRIFAAIQDGMAKPEDYFEPDVTPTAEEKPKTTAEIARQAASAALGKKGRKPTQSAPVVNNHQKPAGSPAAASQNVLGEDTDETGIPKDL